MSEIVFKGGDKDLSKLRLEEKTVIRNGKPMKTRVYVDKDSEDPSSDISGDTQANDLVSATELTSEMVTSKDKLSNVRQELTEISDLPIPEGNTIYKLSDGEGYNRCGIILDITDQTIQLVKVINDGTVRGLWILAIQTTIVMGIKHHKSVQIFDCPTKLEPYLESLGLEKEKRSYSITSDDLQELV